MGGKEFSSFGCEKRHFLYIGVALGTRRNKRWLHFRVDFVYVASENA